MDDFYAGLIESTKELGMPIYYRIHLDRSISRCLYWVEVVKLEKVLMYGNAKDPLGN